METTNHNVFISYKKEDKNNGNLKRVTDVLDKYNIGYSVLDKNIDSDNIDTVISVLRKEYMHNKPVTLFIIGNYSFEDTVNRWKRINGTLLNHDEYNEQSYIIRELRATLSDYNGNPRHGLLGIVMPEMINKIYSSTYKCPKCGEEIKSIDLSDDNVIREFKENYFLKSDECGHYSADGRYCVMCTFDEFSKNPNSFINEAFDKTKKAIAKEVHYKDIKHDFKLRDK